MFVCTYRQIDIFSSATEIATGILFYRVSISCVDNGAHNKLKT